MGLLFPQVIVEHMAAHLTACLPEEGCGLVGGMGEIVQRMVPVENSLHSPVRFCMEATGQLHTMLQFEAESLELVAIFHSHPRGPAHPSATDLSEFAYPGVMAIIAVPDDPDGARLGWLRAGVWRFGGFLMNEQGYLAVKLGYLE